MKIDRNLLPFKAFYFFVYAGMGTLTPYLTLYYQSLGLPGERIGFLAALPPLITFLSAPFFGMLTDITHRPRLLLSISVASVVLTIFSLTQAEGFWALVLIVAFYAFFFAPILPILDRSVLDTLGDPRDEYGKQRLWGAVGWGVIAPIAGALVTRGGLHWTFYLSAVLSPVLLLIIQRIPVTGFQARQSIIKGLKILLGNGVVVIFFLVALGSGVGSALIHHYLFVYLDSLGGNSMLMGWALTMATFSELFILYFSNHLLRWQGARRLLMFSLAALAFRFFAYALVDAPEWALLIQLLHGPTFAASWVAGVAYVAEIAPPGLANTLQGLYTGFVMGLGSALGGFLGGILYGGLGFQLMFVAAGLGMCVLVLLFWFACRGRC